MCLENKEKISIIVPIYNVEKYLNQSLDSLIYQTYKNLEILCIDDGSTDDSKKIVEEFRKKDKRIKYFYQENSGPATARNYGIDQSMGEYLIFVDPDDWCEPQMCEKLLEKIQQTNVDFVMCTSRVYDEVKNSFVSDNIGYYMLDMLSANEFERPLLPREMKLKVFQLPVMVWGKIFKTSFIKKNNIRFIEEFAFEDNAFFMEVFFAASSFLAIADSLMVYRINRKGSETQIKGRKYLDFVFQISYYKQVLDKHSLYQEYEVTFLKNAFIVFESRLAQIDISIKEEFYQKARQFITSLDISEAIWKQSKIIRENYLLYLENQTAKEFLRNRKKCFLKVLFCKKIKAKRIIYFIFGIPIFKIDSKKEKNIL